MTEEAHPNDGESMPEPAPVAAAGNGRRRLQLFEKLDGLGTLLVNHQYIALLLIFLLALYFRLFGLDWDEGQHLHPDERFITMIEVALRLPANVQEYFDSTRNPLSLYNKEFTFYVYGTLPLYLVKLIAELIGQTGYDEVVYVGRVASAVFDAASVPLIFVIGRRLYSVGVGLLAALLFACSVLNIQQAHFFIVDPFAATFMLAALYLAIRIQDEGRWWHYVLAGLAIGCAMASKVSSYPVAMVVTVATLVRVWQCRDSLCMNLASCFERHFLRLVVAGAIALISFRVLQPISFGGTDFLTFSLSERWLANMKEIRELTDGIRDVPFQIQWIARDGLSFTLQNMVWGMGPAVVLAGGLGMAMQGYRLIRYRATRDLLPLLFVALMLFGQIGQFVRIMRYFLPVYPLFCLYAAVAVGHLWRHAASPQYAGQAKGRRWRAAAIAALATLVVTTGLWAVAYQSIYTRTNTRVEASRWMIDNVSHGSRIGNEHWDDSLPLRVDGKDPYGAKWFEGVELTVYDDDTPQKLSKLLTALERCDYLVLSSNRQYDTITRLPLRYPMMERYYRMLFAGELGFEQVAEFTSFPGIAGLQIPDQSAEEAFTVYDHPRVLIYRKAPDFDLESVGHGLSDGLDWNSAVKLRPDLHCKAPTGLMLSDEARERQRAAGSWAVLYARDGVQNQYPLVAWVLALVAVGLTVLPLSLVLLKPLFGGGYLLTRPLGLLLAGWLAWLAGSSGLVSFGPMMVMGIVGVLLLVSAAFYWWQHRRLNRYMRRSWRLLLLQEALFWLLFAGFVAVRSANPDLWHPVMGGEKPMDFAYFNAVLKSASFPPYDPWFAGGYINYYYFGFVLMSVLTHLSGVMPQVAYNLAVPTLFAFTGAAGFVVAMSLAPRLRRLRPGAAGVRVRANWLAGGLGVVFLVLMGNLHELRMMIDGAVQLGKPAAGGMPLLNAAARFGDGARQLLFEGKSFPVRLEGWYWNATRVIEHPNSEAGPINEFPFFTFLYGDMHAHMMALPYTVVALALAVALLNWRGGGAPQSRTWRLGPFSVHWRELGLLLLAALVVGSLWPLNTWDFPFYLATMGWALLVRHVVGNHDWHWQSLLDTGWRWLVVAAGGYLAFLPFHRSYANAYSSIELWSGSRTLIDAYLDMHGIFLLIIGAWLLLTLRRRRAASVVRALRSNLTHLPSLGRRRSLSSRLVRAGSCHQLGSDAVVASLIALLALLVLRLYVIALIGLLGLMLVLALAAPERQPRRIFLLGLTGAALLLTLAVELIVLKGDISRMNTVFKFYLQVWTIWALVSAVVSASWLAETWWQRKRRPGAGAVAASTVLVLFVLAGLLYPVFATKARVVDRFENSREVTLDGAAYQQVAVYEDQGTRYALAGDWAAIRWLQDNVTGTPVILEGTSGTYNWGSRVSIYTGLPTVIGWDWHQRQQRAVMPTEVVNRRLADVKLIYEGTDVVETTDLLDRYAVEYIYLGPLERRLYNAEGLRKFENESGGRWQPVYAEAGIVILQVIR